MFRAPRVPCIPRRGMSASEACLPSTPARIAETSGLCDCPIYLICDHRRQALSRNAGHLFDFVGDARPTCGLDARDYAIGMLGRCDAAFLRRLRCDGGGLSHAWCCRVHWPKTRQRPYASLDLFVQGDKDFEELNVQQPDRFFYPVNKHSARRILLFPLEG